jgi:predicted dehydrogenase
MGSTDLILNWGIVSSGLISQDFCSAILSLNSKHHVLRAIAARTAEDASKFAERFNIPVSYESYDKLFDDSSVNIVYVASINTTHKEICLKAINAGKHVLCEKPMALNLNEQEEILNASKQKKVFFMEVF